MPGEVGENFSVKFNMRFLEAVDKFAVREVVLFCRGANLDLPQAAELSLFLAAVVKLKRPGVE